MKGCSLNQHLTYIATPRATNTASSLEKTLNGCIVTLNNRQYETE